MWRAFLDVFNECIAALTHMIIDCLTTLSKFLFYMHKQSAQKIHQETKHLRTKDFIVFKLVLIKCIWFECHNFVII